MPSARVSAARTSSWDAAAANTARTVGWVAQWNEMIADPEQKIGRPRQLYVGATQRDYVKIGER